MTFSEVEDLRVKEIFTKGLGNDHKKERGVGGAIEISPHTSTKLPQIKSFRELATLTQFSWRPLLHPIVWAA